MKIVEATVLCLSISLTEEILVPHNGIPLSKLLDSSTEREGDLNTSRLKFLQTLNRYVFKLRTSKILGPTARLLASDE